ncbi:MAG: hypothetical protein KR126chlam1_00676 [Chlamydiae bacterium]|nr:hypothetical protein [Chlamydiota bacterium]
MVSLPSDKDKKKKLAEESLKTKKAREKLRKRLEVIDERITEEGLKQKNLEIHRWIARHAENRVTLKDKSISLFDENQNAAEISLKINKIAKKLSQGSPE